MTASLTLAEKLDTNEAENLLDALRSHEGDPLVLDAEHTTLFGALCMQALMVAAEEWRQAELDFTLENLTDDGQRQFALLGIDPETLTAQEPA